ncbi:MarR family transcriptional regulator [Haloterrigena alkaliphila]|uniref:MarR family transcriptional regulator n=1 Tax=Haloterrigena alkaliphila TaxID=2816475 RepID=A0A8A2VCY4_9EURY|nr:MarR family transcriptional regulator [Haloterrigena alkaliphila]QSW98085.1 MarR family transcriptional regulator [Haloterrigena alkaliphila]
MATQSPPEVDISVPTDLESAQAKLVYLYVAASGGATAEQLRDDLGVKKGTALSITGTLRDRGYLERTGSGFELA